MKYEEINLKNILVVLCPGEPLNNYSFEDQSETEDKYLGGDIRMRAAAKVVSEYPLTIVVGGSEKKVGAMKLFLIRHGCDVKKIIRLESNPDTNGNLSAVRKIMDKYKELREYSINILSNDYHRQRIESMAQDILKGLSWKFISAEGLLKEESKIIEEIYSKELKKRNKSEKEGMEDWANKKYKDQDIEPWQFKSVLRDQKLLEAFIKTEANSVQNVEDYMSTFQTIMLDILQRRALFRGFEKVLIGKDSRDVYNNDFVGFFVADYLRSQLSDLRKFFDEDSRSYTIDYILRHISDYNVKQKYSDLESKWNGKTGGTNFRDLANKTFMHKDRNYQLQRDLPKADIDTLIDELNTFLDTLVEQLKVEGHPVDYLDRSENSGYFSEQQNEFSNFLKIVCNTPDK